MNWQHRRDQHRAAQKETETRSGTRWTFVAAAVGAA